MMHTYSSRQHIYEEGSISANFDMRNAPCFVDSEVVGELSMKTLLIKFLVAVTFLEYWKRKSASLAHHWDCMGFQDEEERPRPEFAANAPYLEKNPITGIKEPSFPKAVRMRRIAAGSGIIVLMVNI